MNSDFETYQDVTENGEYLESVGAFVRYATGWEDSVWVCEYCEGVDVDPQEHECSDK